MSDKPFVVRIPDTMPCPWCGKTMERKGATYIGSGINSYTLWCECGGIAHFAKDSDRPIHEIEILYRREGDKR